jgi:hypothetical protein
MCCSIFKKSILWSYELAAFEVWVGGALPLMQPALFKFALTVKAPSSLRMMLKINFEMASKNVFEKLKEFKVF